MSLNNGFFFFTGLGGAEEVNAREMDLIVK